MGADTGRALAIGAAGATFGLEPAAVAALCDGGPHAPPPLSEAEQAGLLRPVEEAPAHIRANVPEWLWPTFEATFGSRAVEEGQGLARRAPADLRVNTLKSTRERVLKALAPFGAAPTPLSPVGVRVAAPQGPARTPNLQAEAAFQAGWFEVQDEGSQIAALLAGAGPRQQVLDFCAGGGGKTLAMAAVMQNTGQIYAYDTERLRLQAIFPRLKRAGARNVQVLRARDRTGLSTLGPRFDLVLVDAPCTGTGVWRRRPEAKWRLKVHSLENRRAEQREVLREAAQFVKPGGRLVYVTCSVLPAENTDQVDWFVGENPEFSVTPTADVWSAAMPSPPPASAERRQDTLLLTPASHDTDGFFVAVLARRGT
jgi:16S rRNA (cytosine967-C5)-methyltransferase